MSDITERLRRERTSAIPQGLLFEAADEIERLRARVTSLSRSYANKEATRYGELEEEIERLTAERNELFATNGEVAALVAQQDAEIRRLKKGMEEYACTGTDKPCGCYAEFVRDTTEIERLRAALKECADDLENELQARYKDTLDYPSQKRRFERDMEPVVEARKLLRPTIAQR